MVRIPLGVGPASHKGDIGHHVVLELSSTCK